MTDLSVDFCGVRFKNPVVTASGTYGFGREYGQMYDLSELGGVCVKGLTCKERLGNPPPRIAETPSGILNSVGLQNPGVDRFIAEELPELRRHDVKVIANMSGNSVDEYVYMARRLSEARVDLLEVNISCPNIKAGGMAFGTSCDAAAQVTEAVKKNASVPVIVKLSPNVTSITDIAKAVEQAGADAISLINTLLGMRIDIHTMRPVLRNNTGGLSGPAVLPVAVRMVWQAAKAVSVPILGMGGVSTGDDAVEMILAGADLVGVGTAMFADPFAPLRVRDGIARYLEEKGFSAVGEIKGKVREYV